MPQFDQWGLIPPGYEGPRENSLAAESTSGSHDDAEASAASDGESSEGTPPPVHRQLRMDATNDNGDDGDDDDDDAFHVVPARPAEAGKEEKTSWRPASPARWGRRTALCPQLITLAGPMLRPLKAARAGPVGKATAAAAPARSRRGDAEFQMMSKFL